MSYFKRQKEQQEFLKNIELLQGKLSQNKPIDFRDEDIEKAKKQEETFEKRRNEAELQRYNQDTTHRNGLVVWAATLVSFWLIGVLLILVNNNLFRISDNVLIALLTTTTVNILGLMIIVLNDLFKGKIMKTEKL